MTTLIDVDWRLHGFVIYPTNSNICLHGLPDPKDQVQGRFYTTNISGVWEDLPNHIHRPSYLDRWILPLSYRWIFPTESLLFCMTISSRGPAEFFSLGDLNAPSIRDGFTW